jgi:hypothetical protein
MKSLDFRRRTLWRFHPDILDSLYHLAMVYLEQGRLIECEKALRECSMGRERVLGVDHPDTAVALTQLAGLFRDSTSRTPGDHINDVQMRTRASGSIVSISAKAGGTRQVIDCFGDDMSRLTVLNSLVLRKVLGHQTSAGQYILTVCASIS